jgi:SAM-dependent methyltransferase
MFARTQFPVKRLPDGRALVNLGSSTKTAPGWNNIEFSWIIRLGRHRWLCDILNKQGWLSEQRYARIRQLDPDTILWDLRKGIPFADLMFDGVYHCHVLEHIDREDAPVFLRECFRVLKPGGILRVVVPDLENLSRSYIECMKRLPENATMEEHTIAVEGMIDQMVVRIPRDRKGQKPVVRFLENLILGDTARNGSLHRWMYDRFSLDRLMRESGFIEIRQCDETSSRIGGWATFHLDTHPDGSPYKTNSIYMEGCRPAGNGDRG